LCRRARARKSRHYEPLVEALRVSHQAKHVLAEPICPQVKASLKGCPILGLRC
jgi:hypothetical protein